MTTRLGSSHAGNEALLSASPSMIGSPANYQESVFDRRYVFNKPIGEWDTRRATIMDGLLNTAFASSGPLVIGTLADSPRWKA